MNTTYNTDKSNFSGEATPRVDYIKIISSEVVQKFIIWHYLNARDIYSWLSRCSTAKGSDIRSSPVGPNKDKACKFFMFT